jgi:hypothetical protein
MFEEYETCKHSKKQVLKTKDKFVKEHGITYLVFGANITVDVEGFF